MEMKTMNGIKVEKDRPLFQGDLWVQSCDAPSTGEFQPVVGPYVVAKSQTGKDHSVEGLKDMRVLRDGGTVYVDLNTDDIGAFAALVHREEADPHRPAILCRSVSRYWCIVRQRESSPWGDRLVAD